MSSSAGPQAVTAPQAPRPVGPYAHAVAAGATVYLSGQIGLEPATGRMVGTTAAEQARQALRNLRAVLESQGLTMRALAKVTVFLTDMGQFAAVNAVYAEEMAGWTPARSVVQVAALPKGALVEIEGIACR
jgi:2-iminobutanoate/2-iminopropanoate deaminase